MKNQKIYCVFTSDEAGGKKRIAIQRTGSKAVMIPVVAMEKDISLDSLKSKIFNFFYESKFFSSQVKTDKKLVLSDIETGGDKFFIMKLRKNDFSPGVEWLSIEDSRSIFGTIKCEDENCQTALSFAVFGA